jgi:hypothetical protein
LTKVLRNGHADLKLTPEEMDRIITWVDINAPYYPFYESAYPNNPCGRSPIDEAQMKRLEALTGSRFVRRHGSSKRSQLSFDRPELSPCLQGLDKASAEYKEALAIIQDGWKQLRAIPRADMDGFVPCDVDRRRLEKYDRRARIELDNRDAIRHGMKAYDQTQSEQRQ